MFDNFRDQVKLMKRHIKVLETVKKEGPIGIVRVSKKTKMPTHQARYSLRILQQSGLIKPSKKGATATEKAKKFMKNVNANVKDLIKELKDIA